MTLSRIAIATTVALAFAASPAFAEDASTNTEAQPKTEVSTSQVQPKADEKPTAKFNALLQAWGLYDSTTTGARTNTRLRRAEVKASGSVIPGSRWFVMADMAKSINPTAGNDGKVLQDLGIGINVLEPVELLVGQFKLPLMAEGLGPTSELLFPERSLPARLYGDKREPGAMLTYKQDIFKVSVMGSNGQATNVDDTNKGKDLTARAEVALLDNALSVGAFSLFGDGATKNRDRFGGNVGWNAQGVVARAEIVTNKAVGNVKSTGFTVDGGYTIADKFQPVLRYSQLKFKAATFTSREETIGFNYLIARHQLKIQAAWSFLQNMTGANGSPTPTAAPSKKGNLFVVAFQSSY